LLPSAAQALLYTAIRNQRPEHVVEIGTYKGGTSETLGRALMWSGDNPLKLLAPPEVL
jgi:predicted O-methyltransferase YrrM